MSGLKNLGNTCFINSCIQVLVHLPPMIQLFDKVQKTSGHPHQAVFIAFEKLRNNMKKKEIIEPREFLTIINQVARKKKNELFASPFFPQCDVHEFLLFLTDCFHDALKREVIMIIPPNLDDTEQDKTASICYHMIKKNLEKEYSEIYQLFYGTNVSRLRSIDKNMIVSETPALFSFISVPFPCLNKSTSLDDCLDTYFENEILQGDNAWYNETTKKKESVCKETVCWSFPDILIICINRFHSSVQKDRRELTYPIHNLDLRKYAVGYDKESYVYDLYGICNHHGLRSSSGHYTAFVQNEKDWFLFNDSLVKKIQHESEIHSSEIYCLFYCKKKQ